MAFCWTTGEIDESKVPTVYVTIMEHLILITHKSRQAFFERSPIGVDPDTFCIDLVKYDSIDQVKDDSATFPRIFAGAVTAVAAPVAAARKTFGKF